MSGYAKLFGSIVHSTVWRESTPTRIVWITLLALKDSRGDVHASVPGLADAARVTREECEQALERLGAPDPDSANKVEEGRRILTIEGGWFVVSHAKYSRMLSIEERRERDALRKRVYRQSANVRGQSANVPDVPDVPQSPPSDQIRSDQIRSNQRERDPERARAQTSMPPGVFNAISERIPKLSTKAPGDFRPLERHRVRMQELKLDPDATHYRFMNHEFQRPYSDWPRRFSIWIEDQKKIAETESYKRGKR